MTALAAPRNRANFTVSYSTDGTSYTTLTVKSAIPSPSTYKVLERRLNGVTRVQKMIARVDHGTIPVIAEYDSAVFVTLSGFSTSTLYYLKIEADDTGGTNNHRFIHTGYWADLTRPQVNGDDEVAEMGRVFVVDNVTYTAGA